MSGLNVWQVPHAHGSGDARDDSAMMGPRDVDHQPPSRPRSIKPESPGPEGQLTRLSRIVGEYAPVYYDVAALTLLRSGARPARSPVLHWRQRGPAGASAPGLNKYKPGR